MTREEIGKMTNEELQKALAEALGWTDLRHVILLGELTTLSATDDKPPQYGVVGLSPGCSPELRECDVSSWPLVPDWPTDPTASAQLRQELWKRLRLYSLVIKAEPDRVTVMIRRAGDYLNPVWVLERLVTDHIAAECLAVAKAALMLLTEAKP